MASSASSSAASPLFLREEEIKRGIELLHFGHAALAAIMDPVLEREGLGRAHQRALYFIARRPGLTVSALIRLLGITKQSLGRVLDELVERGLVEASAGLRHRRNARLMVPSAIPSSVSRRNSTGQIRSIAGWGSEK